MKSFAMFSKPIYTVIALAFCLSLQAQDSKDSKSAAIKKLVESRHYMFVPQSVTPMSAGTRQLNSGSYDMRIMGDSINTYLPYFGRSFSGGYGGDGPIQFKSNDFEYKSTEAKKGGWNILITPKNIRSARQITMRISSDGYTSVQVNSNTRDMVSFNGYIQELN